MVQKTKYSYVLLVATSNYMESLVSQINKLKDIPGSIVVVVNGKDCESVYEKYNQANTSENCSIIRSPLKGKSNALNYYLQTVADANLFFIFTDDDILFPKEVVVKYINAVEEQGEGYFYGGGVDVVREKRLYDNREKYYPKSITGLSEKELVEHKRFLGCNWGAFAKDIKLAGFFNPLYGPGSITGAVGQERVMMNDLKTLGILPYPIRDARVTHIAPEESGSKEWLHNRIYRQGVFYGLQTPLKAFFAVPYWLLHCFTMSKESRLIRFHWLLGVVNSFRYLTRRKL